MTSMVHLSSNTLLKIAEAFREVARDLDTNAAQCAELSKSEKLPQDTRLYFGTLSEEYRADRTSLDKFIGEVLTEHFERLKGA